MNDSKSNRSLFVLLLAGDENLEGRPEGTLTAGLAACSSLDETSLELGDAAGAVDDEARSALVDDALAGVAGNRGGLGNSSAVDTESLSGKREEAATARLEVTVGLDTLVVAAGEVGGTESRGDGASVEASRAAEVLAEASSVTLAARVTRRTGTSSGASSTKNAKVTTPCVTVVADKATGGRAVIGNGVGRVDAAGGWSLGLEL